MRQLLKRELSQILKPQEKFNLELDPSDFRAATNTGWEKQLLGENIYIIDIRIPYEFLYLPTCPFDIYLHSTKYTNLMKIPQNIFIPIDIIDKIILVKSPLITSEKMLFQYWLSDIKSVKIYDIYERLNFDLIANTEWSTLLPFPTYQIRVLLKCDNNPTGLTFKLTTLPYSLCLGRIPSCLSCLDVDNKSGIIGGTAEGDAILNNIYNYDKIGGSGEETNPHYPLPSWNTFVSLKNEDVAVDMEHCYLKIISWED